MENVVLRRSVIHSPPETSSNVGGARKLGMGMGRRLGYSVSFVAMVTVMALITQQLSSTITISTGAGTSLKQVARSKCPNVFAGGFKFNRIVYQRAVFEELSDSTMIIIGANIGDTTSDDSFPLLKDYKGVRKILVEPIPYLFEQLSSNVEKHGIQNATLVNAAIGESNGLATMYCWDPNLMSTRAWPDWFSQVCSFSRSRLYNQSYDTARFGALQEDIVEVSVERVTVRNLFETHAGSMEDISVIQVDTEGFDYNVMIQLPFDDLSFRPCVITWEYVLLSNSQNSELVSWIIKFGYAFELELQNIVMYRVDGK